MPERSPFRTCPECESRLRSAGIETLCSECGLIVEEDPLDRGPEWRAFEPHRERTGAPLTRSRHDRGLSTEIGRGVRLTGRKRRLFARLRRQHNRARIPTKTARNRVTGLSEVRRIVSTLELPRSAREEACALFGRAQDAGLMPGRSLEGFAAASVYAACRIAELSRTVKEVVEAARARPGELRAAYAVMNRELGLPTGPIDPTEYLPRFATQLGLPGAVERGATRLVGRLREQEAIAGRNPGGIAAACLYAAAQAAEHPLTQADAAAAADVTPVTLRNTCQTLLAEGE